MGVAVVAADVAILACNHSVCAGKRVRLYNYAPETMSCTGVSYQRMCQLTQIKLYRPCGIGL